MNVLSLFDGMSCGRIALERAGIPVINYYASEVDKYAITVSKANYPEIHQVGDVTGLKASQFPHIDLIIGGSPCQGFSFAGKQGAFEDPRSALFFEYVRLLSEIYQYNPNVKFLLENVRMKKQSLNLISLFMGVKPILINSALVSAQNRNRLYWTNIPGVCQPEDRGIMLADIIEKGVVDRNKAFCIDANYWRGGNLKSYFEKHRRQLVFDARNGKKVEINDYNIIDKEFYYRKLTPVECERLQTVPDNYTNHVSNTQRYKMLGNGWTVDVIAHMMRGLT